VNRWQSEDGDAAWRIALPWRRSLRCPSAFSSLSFISHACPGLYCLCVYVHYHSVGYQPSRIPPNHVIILLEGLTTLCQYCLLDGSTQQEVGLVGQQMSPLTRTGSSSDNGLLSSLANVFHFGSQRVLFIIPYHLRLRTLTIN